MSICCRAKKARGKRMRDSRASDRLTAARNKYLFVALLLLSISLVSFAAVGTLEQAKGQEKEELLIVTSFYPMYVAVCNVAADCPGVTVRSLSQPQTGCLHDYQLTPEDLILLSEADVFVINGGGMEQFLMEVAAEYPDLTIVEAGAEVFAREEAVGKQTEGNETGIADDETGGAAERNGHIWMSIDRYRMQVSAICAGLSALFPAHQQQFEQNAGQYLQQIDLVEQEAEELRAAAAGEKVILFHEAFAYLAEDYGMEVVGTLDLDEERQVSARETADILKTIEEKRVRILLAEDLYGKEMGDTMEAETDCRACYLDTLVRGEADAGSWLNGMRHNIRLLKAALEEKP